MFDAKLLEEKQKTWDYIKSTLPAGPWDKEPMRVEFKHRGFDCLMQRQAELGHWCGYVGMPPGHPFYKVPYSDLDHVIAVHGGLTYSEKCAGIVCHMTEGNDDLWWLGFDCAHSGDLTPFSLKYRNRNGNKYYSEEYRDLGYVKACVKDLAEQLA